MLMTFMVGKIPPSDMKAPKIERLPTPTKEKKKVGFTKRTSAVENKNPIEGKEDSWNDNETESKIKSNTEWI